MKNIKSYLLLLLVSSFVFGCAEEDTPISDPNSPLRGRIQGNCTLQDEFAVALKNASGITVTLKGTGLVTTTDSLGNYGFDSVRAGTYDVMFEKAGFPARVQRGYSYTGGPAIPYYGPNSELRSVSTSQVTGFTVSVDTAGMSTNGGWGRFICGGNVINANSTDGAGLPVQLVFSTEPQPDFTNRMNWEQRYVTFDKGVADLSSSYSFQIVYYLSSIPKGATVYVRAFPGFVQEIYDPVTGKTAMGGYGTPSQVVSFVKNF